MKTEKQIKIWIKEQGKWLRDYDGNNLEEANKHFCIAADDWQEIVRFEDGFNLAIRLLKDFLLTKEK